MSHNPALLWLNCCSQWVLLYFLASSFFFFYVYLYFQRFPNHEDHWVCGCKAPLWLETAFASLHGFVLHCRDKVFPSFPSSPQFCPILTTFPYPSHQYLFSASVPQSSNSPCLLAALLFPNYNPFGYEGVCLREYILFLNSHLQCAFIAALSASGTGHWGLSRVVPCGVGGEYEILILELGRQRYRGCAAGQKVHEK